MTELNISSHLPSDPCQMNLTSNLSSGSGPAGNFSLQHMPSQVIPDCKREGLNISMQEGFKAGASHVHTVAGAILFLYAAQFAVYLLATRLTRLFESEESASEFYRSVARGMRTGRFLMVLLIFQKTMFTFVSYGGAR